MSDVTPIFGGIGAFSSDRAPLAARKPRRLASHKPNLCHGLGMSGGDSQPLLKLDDVAKRFGPRDVLKGVSFQVPAGSITGFIGVNGAGKSTTLKCVMGILEPDGGRVALFGGAPDFKSRSRIGFLAEERGLSLRERVRDVIAFHAALKGTPYAQALRRADALLERIGLQHRGKSRIGDLSKGNAQRIQLLCALAHGPSLLVLDEPFSGLDPVGQSEIQTLFSEHRASGGSILLSTHGMATAEKLCDRVVILSGGRAVFEGEVEAATALAPHGAYVSVDDEAALLEIAASLGGKATPFPSKLGSVLRWQVQLPQSVPYVSLGARLGPAPGRRPRLRTDRGVARRRLLVHGQRKARDRPRQGRRLMGRTGLIAKREFVAFSDGATFWVALLFGPAMALGAALAGVLAMDQKAPSSDASIGARAWTPTWRRVKRTSRATRARTAAVLPAGTSKR